MPLPQMFSSTSYRRAPIALGWIVALVAFTVGCGSNSQGSSGTFTPNPTSGGSSGGDVGTSSSSGTDSSSGGVTDAGSSSGAAADSGSGPKDTGGKVDAGSGAKDTGPGNVDAGSAPKDTNIGPVKTCTFDAFIGPTGLECGGSMVCVGNQGQCKGKVQGICKPKIVSCPKIKAPVCGCDDTTYDNVCEAQKANVTVKNGGKCGGAPTACGGTTGVVCPKDFLCDITSCDKSASGLCVPLPKGSCPPGGIPECGCDGKSYPNGCFRLKAQMPLKQKGSCPSTGAVECKIGPAGKPSKCPADHYCKLNPNNPVDCTGNGNCTPIPKICDNVSSPVCGCDFQSYTNPCHMAKAHVSSKNAGKCGGSGGGCTEGKGECPAGQYCGVPQGNCGTKGICINKAPQTQCTTDVDVVCGCNKTTYSNPGCAAHAGVIIKHKGPCKP